MVQIPTTTEEEFTPEMAEDYIQSNIFDFEEELLADELANDATEDNIAPDHKPKEKRRNKLPKEMDELDDILNDLTDEELEDLL